MQSKDLLSVSDLTTEDIKQLITHAIELKKTKKSLLLQGKTLALLFEKPSLRTRVSFDMAMFQMGGHAIYLSPDEVGLGKRESVADVAHVLERYVDIITARTFSHQTLVELAHHASIPVINALSDFEHPCQALADIMTIYEKKHDLSGLTVTYIGDGNNVANSLLLAATLSGMNFNIASPDNYTIDPKIVEQAQKITCNNANIRLFTDPHSAIIDADVIYTDVWTSMGQEAEREQRRKDFAGYQINNELLSQSKPDAIIMHPLPAHYGEEVAEGILYHPNSVVFDEAENRLHIQKAVLALLAA